MAPRPAVVAAVCVLLAAIAPATAAKDPHYFFWGKIMCIGNYGPSRTEVGCVARGSDSPSASITRHSVDVLTSPGTKLRVWKRPGSHFTHYTFRK
jgi:hypothetical protein